MEGIAERLKRAREAAGLTQPELAAKVGVSQGTIGNIETGLRKRPRDLLAIAAALRVDPHWLETGKTSPSLPAILNGAPSNPLPHSLEVIAAALRQSDDLVRDQASPLLAHLVKTPERAPEIIPRLSALLDNQTTFA